MGHAPLAAKFGYSCVFHRNYSKLFEIEIMRRIFFIDTYRLARLSPKNTGLEQDVFLYSHGYRQGSRAYVLVRKRLGYLKVYLDKASRAEPEGIRPWIEANMGVLLRHWSGKIDDSEALLILCRRGKKDVQQGFFQATRCDRINVK